MSGVTKAVVLARGAGTRMREPGASVLDADQAAAADAGAKAMMPLPAAGAKHSQPFLSFVLSTLADAGYERVCLVIGPEHVETRRYYREIAPPQRLSVEFAEQAAPRGTADAVAAASGFIGRDRTLVINGDNYYPLQALAALHALDEPATMLFRADTLVARSNIPRDRVRAFAIGTVDEVGFLARIIEKPTPDELRDAGPGALVSMNCWIVPPQIVEACRAIAPSLRGELELTHAIGYAMDTLGVRFKVLVSEEGVLDLSRRDDVEAVAARLSEARPRP